MPPIFLKSWKTRRSTAPRWNIWAVSVWGLSYHSHQHELWWICGQCSSTHSPFLDLCSLTVDRKGKKRKTEEAQQHLTMQRGWCGAGGKWDWLWMPVCETGLTHTQMWYICPCAPLTVYALTSCHGRWHGVPDDYWFFQFRWKIPPPRD